MLALGGFLLIVCSCKFVYFAARFSLKTPPPVKVLGWFVDFINSWFVGHASISKNNKSLLDSHSLVAIMNVPVSHRGSTLVLLFFIITPSCLLGR